MRVIPSDILLLNICARNNTGLIQAAYEQRHHIHTDSPDFVEFVLARTQMVMTTYNQIVEQATTNPLALNYEDTYWKLHSISNLLVELRLVQKEEIKKPATTFHRKLATAFMEWGKVSYHQQNDFKGINTLF